MAATDQPQALPQAGWEEERAEEESSESFFLGWLTGGRRLAPTFDQLLVSIAVGSQGWGKTTASRIMAMTHAERGGHVILFDGYNDVAQEMAPFFSDCYQRPEDVERASHSLCDEADRRIEAYSKGERAFIPLLIVVDDLPQYEDVCPGLVTLLKKGNDVCRKVRMRFFVSGTRFPAASLGGQFAKANTANVLIFKHMDGSLLGDFGIHGKLAEQLESALFNAGKGFCVFRSSTMSIEGTMLKLRDITPKRFKSRLSHVVVSQPAYAGSTTSTDDLSLSSKSGAGPILAPLPKKRRALAKVTPQEYEDIKRYWGEGKSITKIAKLCGHGGDWGVFVEAVLEEEGLIGPGQRNTRSAGRVV
jgi:hypothetical protein